MTYYCIKPRKCENAYGECFELWLGEDGKEVSYVGLFTRRCWAVAYAIGRLEADSLTERTARVRQLATDFVTDFRGADPETETGTVNEHLFNWIWEQIRANVGIPFEPLSAEYRDLRDAARAACTAACRVADI